MILFQLLKVWFCENQTVHERKKKAWADTIPIKPEHTTAMRQQKADEDYPIYRRLWHQQNSQFISAPLITNVRKYGYSVNRVKAKPMSYKQPHNKTQS